MQTLEVSPSLIEGAVSLEETTDGLRPWRIPHEQRVLFYPEDRLQYKAAHAAGVRLRFRTDSTVMRLHAVVHSEDEVRFDLTSQGALLQTVSPAESQRCVRFEGLNAESTVYELWLPQFGRIDLRGIEIDDGAHLCAVDDNSPRWIAYGSSITQCRTAHSPARTWPALVARKLGLNLTCLGYGGNCMLEPMVARVIRDLRADLITCKLGINVYSSAALNARTYQPAVIGLVRTIREKHPTVPIAIISPIISPPHETTPNAVGLTLQDYRRENNEAVGRLLEAGDDNLYLFNAAELFGKTHSRYLPDGVHPDGEGYEILGDMMAEHVVSKLLRNTTMDAKRTAITSSK